VRTRSASRAGGAGQRGSGHLQFARGPGGKSRKRKGRAWKKTISPNKPANPIDVSSIHVEPIDVKAEFGIDVERRSLADYASLGAAVARVEERWGGIDVLVNNGRYIGPGHMDLMLETPIDLLEKQVQANVLAIIVLCKLVVPGMIARGGGTILNITSGSAYADPTQPAGKGGWGLGYGISKGAMQRIAGFLNAELGEQGIRAYNVQPNLIATERIAADMGEFGIVGGAPADVMGAVCKWIVEHPDEVPGGAGGGVTIEAQYECWKRNLLPGWDGPEPNLSEIRYDLAGAEAVRIEDEIREWAAGNP